MVHLEGTRRIYSYQAIKFWGVLSIGFSRGKCVKPGSHGIVLIGVVLAVILLQVSPNMVHFTTSSCAWVFSSRLIITLCNRLKQIPLNLKAIYLLKSTQEKYDWLCTRIMITTNLHHQLRLHGNIWPNKYKFTFKSSNSQKSGSLSFLGQKPLCDLWAWFQNSKARAPLFSRATIRLQAKSVTTRDFGNHEGIPVNISPSVIDICFCIAQTMDTAWIISSIICKHHFIVYQKIGGGGFVRSICELYNIGSFSQLDHLIWRFFIWHM